MFHDLRQALRSVLRARGFALAAAFTLAVGIGAVTALTSVLDMLLFRPPVAVAAPDELVRVYFHHKSVQFGDWTNSVVSYPDLTTLQGAHGFQGVAAMYGSGASLGRGAEAQPVSLAGVTGNYFPLLGATPLAGRLLVPADDEAGHPAPVAVLSERLWRNRYGADPAVVGQAITLDDREVTIVGVAPAGFDGGESSAPEMWLPLGTIGSRLPGGPDAYRTDYGWYFIQLIGRLAPGVTAAQATAEASGLVLAARTEAKDLNNFEHVVFGPINEAAGPNFTRTADLARWLAAMSLLVLLIACANVANLMLARGLVRSRELAVRKALGAGQGRLVRQLFLEGVLIALVAGGLGVLLSAWGAGLLRGYVLPPAMAERFTIDGRVFLIALGATALAALLSSLVPALRVTRADLTPMLKEGGRGSGFRRSRLRAALVVAQVALSVVLVIGAGLFARSLRNVLGIDVGYDQRQVIIVNANPSSVGFTGTRTMQAFEAMAAAARAHPGVESAALTFGEPFGWSMAEGIELPGGDSLPRLSSGGPYIQRTTADYFRTVGLRILRGRGFTEAERLASPTVAVVGATMAARMFPGRDPVGQCLLLGKDPAGCTTIIGVAEDGVRYSPREEPQALYYVPLPPDDATTHLTLFVRTRGAAAPLVAGLREQLQVAAPGLPYVTAEPMTSELEPAYRDLRVGATLFGLYAAVALLLAALGMYGVLAYAVRGRTQELGVRLALGAAPDGLVRMVLGDGLRFALIGAGLGLAGALAGGRALASLLYNVPAWDPVTLGLALATVLVTAVVAGLLPARRAARVDPAIALRSE